VAPQNDICPQTSTYPINAVAMSKSKITIPEVHVSFFLNDWKKIPRPMWK